MTQPIAYKIASAVNRSTLQSTMLLELAMPLGPVLLHVLKKHKLLDETGVDTVFRDNADAIPVIVNQYGNFIVTQVWNNIYIHDQYRELLVNNGGLTVLLELSRLPVIDADTGLKYEQIKLSVASVQDSAGNEVHGFIPKGLPVFEEKVPEPTEDTSHCSEMGDNYHLVWFTSTQAHSLSQILIECLEIFPSYTPSFIRAHLDVFKKYAEEITRMDGDFRDMDTELLLYSRAMPSDLSWDAHNTPHPENNARKAGVSLTMQRALVILPEHTSAFMPYGIVTDTKLNKV